MAEESQPQTELHISPEIEERLDARRILREDVQAVIEHAEATGQKFCMADTGRFLASFRPRAVAFWVEYSPDETGFRVHNAYAHRMVAERGIR